MSRNRAWLLRLYPPAWRERYGAEFEALLEDEPLGPLAIADLVRAALVERIFNPSGLKGTVMQAYPASVFAMVRRPSAYVPLLMSLGAAALLLAFIIKFGLPHPDAPPHDERMPARLFQLLLLGQLPVILLFAARWLRKDMRAGLTVLGLQLAALAVTLILVPPGA